MKKIDSFVQLCGVIEGAEVSIKRPLRVLVPLIMIVMIQLRRLYDSEAEARYAECMAAGEALPAIKGHYDLAAEKIYCFDGEHRLNAARKNGETHIIMELTPGTKRDAVLRAAGENDIHGVDRKDEDKRNIVMTLLEDKEWRCWSSTRIAKITRTSVPFVEKLRQEKESPGEGTVAGEPQPTQRKVVRNGKEYSMKVKTKAKKDPVEVALTKIVKLVESFDGDDRKRLTDAIPDKLKSLLPLEASGAAQPSEVPADDPLQEEEEAPTTMDSEDEEHGNEALETESPQGESSNTTESSGTEQGPEISADIPTRNEALDTVGKEQVNKTMESENLQGEASSIAEKPEITVPETSESKDGETVA